MYCTKLQKRAVYCGEQGRKIVDEAPTDQEHMPGDRAGQAHCVQLTSKSISFDYLIVVEINSRFCLMFLGKALF